MSEMHKWKKTTYLTIKVKVNDTFYAKTPDLRDSSEYPFSTDAKVKIMETKFDRHTIEMDTDLDKPPHKNDNPPY